MAAAAMVAEGWWHPNVKDGRVHDHPDDPGGGWSAASHRLCEPVYTRRGAAAVTTIRFVADSPADVARFADELERFADGFDGVLATLETEERW